MDSYPLPTLQAFTALATIIQQEKNSATFAMGGRIPIQSQSTPPVSEGSAQKKTYGDNGGSKEQEQGEQPSTQTQEQASTRLAAEKTVVPTSPPITIRWDSGENPGNGLKLKLPLETDTGHVGLGDVDQLINDCEEATFGMAGQEVYDPSYRKAQKMDPKAFCTDFDPHSLGIIDAICQVLLPNVGAGRRGVRAELYKLNIYSAPSGKFRAHVDTPRKDAYGNLQFGSLVIALPCAFSGGELVVRHSGNTVKFDWGSNTSAVSYAAFYSDCEHEVLEVTAGHRITLTYNLYVTRGVGLLAGHCPVIDPKMLPLFEHMKKLLDGGSFKGDRLGVMCSHYYAHTERFNIHRLPSSLKGIDMVVFEVFRSLGLKPQVLPVLKGYDEFEDWDSYGEAESIEYMPRIGEKLVRVTAKGGSIEDGDCLYEEDDPIESIPGDFQHQKVTWLSQTPKDIKNDKYGLQMAALGYGNCPSLDTFYTAAAIIGTVPIPKKKKKKSSSAANDPKVDNKANTASGPEEPKTDDQKNAPAGVEEPKGDIEMKG